jgi:FAD/FMN-containing dehydrogenase
MKLEGWGRTNSADAKFVSISDASSYARFLQKTPRSHTAIPRGNGRSYGDQALNYDEIWSSRRLDHFLSFDSENGILEVESGVTLGEIQKLFIPLGWSVAVSPGTQFVTVGGALANDVHGKNHHSHGTFGEHVLSLKLLRTDGELLECSKTTNPQMLRATIGGLGLTGLIVSARLKLRKVDSPWIAAETLTFDSTGEFFEQTANSENHEFTVSWLDIKKRSVRGLFNRGNLAPSQDLAEPKGIPLAVPLVAPFSLINRATSRPLASAYNWLGSRSSSISIVHYQPFFYPLDGIANWNRAYGPKGFFQHQSVLPVEAAASGLEELIAAVRDSGERSVVSVLKTTGKREHPGLLTYPIEGLTLALDFANRGSETLKLMRRLDEITVANGGRVNPSKDATMTRATFESSFGDKLAEFKKYRDPGISSHQSKRLLGN